MTRLKEPSMYIVEDTVINRIIPIYDYFRDFFITSKKYVKFNDKIFKGEYAACLETIIGEFDDSKR